jgi:hypothetical protein
LGGDAIHAKEEGVAVLDVHLNYVIRLFLNAASLMCGFSSEASIKYMEFDHMEFDR